MLPAKRTVLMMSCVIQAGGAVVRTVGMSEVLACGRN